MAPLAALLVAGQEAVDHVLVNLQLAAGLKAIAESLLKKRSSFARFLLAQIIRYFLALSGQTSRIRQRIGDDLCHEPAAGYPRWSDDSSDRLGEEVGNRTRRPHRLDGIL